MSNFKIISSYHSTINLYTTSMGAESFVKPKKYIGGISDLAALARHSLDPDPDRLVNCARFGKIEPLVLGVFWGRFLVL